MAFFEYKTMCPECQKLNVTSQIGFDSDSGKILCNGEIAHEFESLPGEAAPVVEDVKLPTTSEFQTDEPGFARDWTPEESAALDAQMAQAPRRDFGGQVTEARDEIAAVAAEEQPAEGIYEPLHDVVVLPAVGGYGLPNAATVMRPETGTSQPMVGLGGFIALPNGDVLCGVRISETWVSAMAAEGENQGPPKNVGEYLQEIIDMGLIEWHCSGPVPR